MAIEIMSPVPLRTNNEGFKNWKQTNFCLLSLLVFYLFVRNRLFVVHENIFIDSSLNKENMFASHLKISLVAF